MAHGGYGNKGQVKPAVRRSKGPGVDKKKNKKIMKKNKPKFVSLKNQIRSIERMLTRNLPSELREAQKKKLEELKKRQENQIRVAADRKIKLSERKKIERRIQFLEKLKHSSSDQAQAVEIREQLSNCKEDLEYVRYFPENEKYVPLFSGGDGSEIVDKRNRFRNLIKERLVDATASSEKKFEASGVNGVLDLSDDDFFHDGSSNDEAAADDEWIDKSIREETSSASGKPASGMSSDERNQRQISARSPMPIPWSSNKALSGSVHPKPKFGTFSSRNSSAKGAQMHRSSNGSNSKSGLTHTTRESLHSGTGNGPNLSNNSDAYKPRRKRRPKKKKKQES